MRYPPSFIERLKNQVRLSELIGKRLPLKKHGKEYMGLCPFHGEKTPSFTVNDEKGFYHCFGCASHGDAIGFISQYEHMTYKEAIEALARETGTALPEFTPQMQQRAAVEKSLFEVMEKATKWFRQQLSTSTGQLAHDYLANRGLNAATLEQFMIGYAPDNREGLKTHLLKSGIKEPQMVEAGLIIHSDNGPTYDRFRGRIMFPIRDANGKTVAFGGRLLSADKTDKLPKYLNSPETPLFKKGELLFNLNIARKPARAENRVLVMEGYMDVIVCAQAGIPACVATLGTAVTPEHLRLLWGLADAPIMCLDGDAAGQRAMLKVAQIALPLLMPGKGLRFARLPTGDDPDSLVRRLGADTLLSYAQQAVPLADTLWQSLSMQTDFKQPESRAALDNQLMQLADSIADLTTRSHFRKTFRDALWRAATPARSSKNGKPVEPAHKRSTLVETMARQDMVSTAPHTRKLLAIVLQCPALLAHGMIEDTIFQLECEQLELLRLRDALAALPHDARESALQLLSQQDFEKLVHDLRTEYPPTSHETDEAYFMQCWQDALGSYHIALLERDCLTAQMAMGAGDDSAFERLMALQVALREARGKLARGTET